MGKLLFYIFCFLAFNSCIELNNPPNIQGTWELLSATTIRNDSSIVQDLENKRMIKIINQHHFAFLNHDNNNGKDTTAHFVAGGGAYSLVGNQYKESLEYCNFRDWEGHNFTFSVFIKGDTLIQEGIEEIEELGIEQKIIEKYTRVKVGRKRNIYATPLM
ncbi:hypothetical protein EI427_23530 [Flammeovirga pectinis]|uniref:Lipocalin-like domain-containing protein n=1 Tax=Flammeovirga pectinis TaxID=2494373 RepID=A0A3Q9FR64_9BACT|nr:hypothetical protein [Flammeovirga pectinis]AZQ65188.1 hypothetical protein EI427_23530 [Flammeovirga pectinis]